MIEPPRERRTPNMAHDDYDHYLESGELEADYVAYEAEQAAELEAERVEGVTV